MHLKVAPLFLTAFIGIEAAVPWSKSTLSATDIIQRSIDALGGDSAMRHVQSVRYLGPELFRSQTLMEAWSLESVDRYVAQTGSRNVSFSYEQPLLRQRIEHQHRFGDFWMFSSPQLEPIEYTLTVKGGIDGYACYVQGNNELFLPRDVTRGYTDELLAAYLVREAEKMSPLLTFKIKENNSSVARLEALFTGEKIPAIFDVSLNLTVLFDPLTYLPYAVRSTEEYLVYGPSTISEVLVNPSLSQNYFDGLPTNDSTPHAPSTALPGNFTFGQISEWSAASLWSEPYSASLDSLVVTHPLFSVPQFWHLTFADDTGFTQVVWEFEDAVIVGEAPAHQSHLVLQWVNEYLNRNVTHIWVTHHHHDHAYGLKDYVDAGAVAVIPDVAVKHWSKVPGIRFETYNASHPFIYRGHDLQVRFIHMNDPYHAEDMSYAFTSAACPESDDTVAVYQGDFWNPGLTDYKFDQAQGVQLLNQMTLDRVTAKAIVIPVHGVESPLIDLINDTGFAYVAHNATSFVPGGALCV